MIGGSRQFGVIERKDLELEAFAARLLTLAVDRFNVTGVADVRYHHPAISVRPRSPAQAAKMDD